MDESMQAIVNSLQRSLHPDTSKEAEAVLKQQETTPGFSIVLLQIVAQLPEVRLAAALYFKNFIKRNWIDGEGRYKLPANDVSTVKKELVGIMISQPPQIQTQLGEAISVIAESDFHERWENLVADLVSRFTPDNPTVNNGVLQVAHSVFKRWRPLFRSDALYTEINFVLNQFVVPFLRLFQDTDAQIDANRANTDVLRVYFDTLNLILKLIYDLSCHDLPPDFVDNLEHLRGLLYKYLTYDNSALHTSNDSTAAGPLEYVKAGIFDVLILYTSKYADDIKQHLGNFIECSWMLLTNIGLETKNDILVSRALQFLTSVVSDNDHAQMFSNETTLSQMTEKVILPNLSLRESDVEMFEDEPIEFIRRDLEGSQSDTRRRAATDLLRQLMSQFESLVTSVANVYISKYLQHYAASPTVNWRSKDTAVYLFCSIASKGTPTAQFGVKTLNTHVSILDFFRQNIANDLTSECPHPIVKVSAIKFVYLFRSQLTRDDWRDAFPLLVNHLQAPNIAIHTYASIAIERALYLTDDQRQPIISRETVTPLSGALFKRLFGLILQGPAPEKVQENEFLIKCVMRVLVVVKQDVSPNADGVLKNLTNITNVIRGNPSNPRFCYYHFESIGALIIGTTPSQSDSLESDLYDALSTILRVGVEEFTPYALQLLEALLQTKPPGVLPAHYKSLIPPLLMASSWETKGNTPALVRLLSALIIRDPATIVQNNHLVATLGIFQKLVSTKINETHGFDLLEAIVTAVPVDAIGQYFAHILNILFTRLSGSRTDAFTSRFVRFYHFVAARDDQGLGCDFFIKQADEVQHDIFRPFYPHIILQETPKLIRPVDRKIAVVSLTKALTDGEAFLERYRKGWAYTCETVLKLLINPPAPPATDKVFSEQDIDDISFGIGFTQLNTCRKPVVDPFPGIANVKVWVGEYMKQANLRKGGRMDVMVQERLSPEVRQTLVAVMQG